MKKITQSRLQEILIYDSETGFFTWRVSKGPMAAGSKAGTLGTDGYIHISVDGKLRLAHRIAWLYMYGEMPKRFIDHINGIKTDNRIVNLRDVTRQQNLCNQLKPSVNNKSGFLGVSFHKRDKKYRAKITVNRRTINLGNFDTAEDASFAYQAAKLKRDAYVGLITTIKTDIEK